MTQIWPMIPFYTPRKHQKTKGLLVFGRKCGKEKWDTFLFLTGMHSSKRWIKFPKKLKFPNYQREEALSKYFSKNFFWTFWEMMEDMLKSINLFHQRHSLKFPIFHGTVAGAYFYYKQSQPFELCWLPEI